MKKMMVLMVLALCGAASVNLWAQELPRQELPSLAVVEFTPNIVNEKTKADTVTVRNLAESQMVASGKYQVIAMNIEGHNISGVTVKEIQYDH